MLRYSVLDAQTVQAIHTTLQRLAGERTVIEVTHNLRQAVNADWICVLDRGRQVEQGTHTALMDRRGTYYTLWKHQTNETGPGVFPIAPLPGG